MKVILLEDVENLGKKYEVKEVAAGHARNFLIPNKLVKPANKNNLEWLKKQQEEVDLVAEEDLKLAQELASKLDDLEVNIEVKVGDNGQLFESISAQKVSEKLKSMGFEVKKAQIKLEEPIKEAGEFPVKITLDHNLEADITVIVTGEKGSGKGEEEEI